MIFTMLLFIFNTSTVSQAETHDQCIRKILDLKAADWQSADRAKKNEPLLVPVKNRLLTHSHKPTHITVHYSGVKAKPETPLRKKLRGLFNYSLNGTSELKKNLWGDIPYHFYLDANNRMAEGRSLNFQPDTNTNYNPDGHITIVVEGDNSDDLSPERKAKLFQMIEALQNTYNLTASAVGGHSDHADGTQCPGPAVGAALSEYKRLHRAYRPNPRACAPDQQIAKWPARTAPKAKPAASGSADLVLELDFETPANR